MPRMKPLKAIAKLSSMSEPLKYNSSGMLFYEDSTGFRFRSLENMLAIGGVARPVTAILLSPRVVIVPRPEVIPKPVSSTPIGSPQVPWPQVPLPQPVMLATGQL